MRVDQIASFRYVFRGIRLVMVDEVSMIGSEIFHTINSRMGQILDAPDEPFGGCHMIFSEDLRQLPPVKAQPIYKRSKNRIGGDMLWHKLDYYPLTKVMRQSDEVFSAILTKIGNGDKLSREECAVVEGRFRTEAAARKENPDAVRLFATNGEVERYNRKVAEDMDASVITADAYVTATPSHLIATFSNPHLTPLKS